VGSCVSRGQDLLAEYPLAAGSLQRLDLGRKADRSHTHSRRSRGPMNGPDEHGRVGPAAEIATEAGGPKPFNRALWTYPAGSDTHTEAQSRFFFDSCRFSCSSFVV